MSLSGVGFRVWCLIGCVTRVVERLVVVLEFIFSSSSWIWVAYVCLFLWFVQIRELAFCLRVSQCCVDCIRS